MNAKARPAGLLVLAVGLFTLAFAAPAAGDTTDIIEPQLDPPLARFSGFQAGTCTKNIKELGPPTVFCSEETPELFYEEAAGHPPSAFTQYIIQHGPFEPTGLPSPPFPPGTLKAPIKEPILDRSIKTLQVDIPPGFSVNPEATPRCSLAEFVNVTAEGIIPACDQGTAVGLEEVTLVTNAENVEVPGLGTIPTKGFVIPPTPGISKVPVFNLEPKEGEPALFGFIIARQRVIYIEGDVAWESDYHESFQIRPPEPTIPGLSTLISRLVNYGQDAGNFKVVAGAYEEEAGEPKVQPTGSGDGTFLTLPTTCYDPDERPDLYSTWFRAESYGEPNPTFPEGSTPVEAELPPETQPVGCNEVPFDPGIDVEPGTTDVDSPSPATVTTTLPFDPETEGGENRMQSHLRSAEVTLPQGMGLNPSAANTVVACTDAQFAKGVRVEDNSCPGASDIGTAEVETPPLPAGTLKGDIYLGEQKSFDPTSGEQFRTLIEVKSKAYGVVVRLVAHVKADPVTGQLTTELNDQFVGPLAGPLPSGLAQVPFESVTLKFDGGEVLSTPPTCGPNDTTTAMEPWARPGTFESPPDSFTLTSAPGGGDCPKSMAERPFKPGFIANADIRQAGSYTPLRFKFIRPQGDQELKGIDVTLPEGLTGKLAGIPYCPETAIAAAVAKTGAAELAAPSCSSASQIGNAVTTSGTGDNPLKIAGKVYLAGPYKGAPLSLVVVTPAKAGPFDLGTVVIRAAIQVDPVTTRVRSISDPVPDVFGGVKLDIREVAVDLDRPEFMRTPTNCDAKSIDAVLSGGGGDPTNPAAWSSHAASALFGALDCKSLKFKPKLFTRILGGKGVTKRTKNPKFRAVLEAREGDANIKRTALRLPSAVILDQGHIRTVCTRVQLAAKECPKNSIYGHARARTPLLDDVLKGPVYLVSSTNQLPDLVPDLRGQVNVQLHGVISSKRGGLKTVFPAVPDVPVKKFILTMKGGNRGLLVNTTNLCKKKRFAVVNLKAQNGKKIKKKKHPLKIKGCQKKKKGGKR